MIIAVHDAGANKAMLGTLDNPPVILEQDRGKLALLSLVLLLLTFLFASFYSAGLLRGGALAQGLLVYGFAALTGLSFWSLYRPDTLKLDEHGLEWRYRFWTLHYQWSDFENFYVFCGPSLSQPAAVFSKSCKRYRLFRLFFLGTFGTCWEIGPSEVVDLLNRAQELWSGGRSVRPAPL